MSRQAEISQGGNRLPLTWGELASEPKGKSLHLPGADMGHAIAV